MRVVGLDLSLSATGLATEDGTSTFKVRGTGMPRLVELRDLVLRSCHQHLTLDEQLRCAILQCPDQTDLVVIEGYSMGTARQSSHAHGLGELGGVIRLALWEAGIAYVDVPPACVKKYATGKGNANKEAVLIAAVKRGAEVKDNNEADAWWLRAMGMDALGAPVVTVPALNRTALATVAWPTKASAS